MKASVNPGKSEAPGDDGLATGTALSGPAWCSLDVLACIIPGHRYGLFLEYFSAFITPGVALLGGFGWSNNFQVGF